MKLSIASVLIGIAVAAVSASAHGQSTPACNTPQHRQFDFWVGTWDVSPTGQGKVVARSVIENLYGGCVIRENWKPNSGNPGGSLNTYSPDDGKWHQVWMDSANSMVMFDGGIVDGKMVLTGHWKGAQTPGKSDLVRMTYSKHDKGAVRQFGEISGDEGKTWKPFFDFTYMPVPVSQ